MKTKTRKFFEFLVLIWDLIFIVLFIIHCFKNTESIMKILSFLWDNIELICLFIGLFITIIMVILWKLKNYKKSVDDKFHTLMAIVYLKNKDIKVKLKGWSGDGLIQEKGQEKELVKKILSEGKFSTKSKDEILELLDFFYKI